MLQTTSNRLVGTWIDDIIEGRGLYLYPDDGMYDGEFKQGVRDGKGTHKYANGMGSYILCICILFIL